MKINKIIRYFKEPYLFLLLLARYNIIHLSDEKFIRYQFKKDLKYDLNLNNPKSFNEKLQWLKIYDRKQEYTLMVDKYEVKKIVANIIGNEYIIPTIQIYDRYEDIDFRTLPNKFVMKCTHYGGGNGVFLIRDKNKIDYKKLKANVKKIMKKNLYNYGKEWPYKNIKPRIIVEKYMEDDSSKDLKDYKFFCFNGKVKLFKIDFNRFVEHRANYYDKEGNLLYFGEKICPPDFNENINMPHNLNKMIELAEKLAQNITFVRIDFYEVDNKIYFGEITFYPASGFGAFIPEEWDLKLGEMLDLEKEIK